MSTVVRQFDPKHDTKSEGAFEDVQVIRVPCVKFTLPAPAGTSRDKYEPAYLEQLILKHWRKHWKDNPALKPTRGKVPAHLPQYRIITDVEAERQRLIDAYGFDAPDRPNVDVVLPGDRLWQAIRQAGEYVTLRRGTHHETFIESTARPIPEDATPYDVVDLGALVAADIEETPDEEIETEASLAARETAQRTQQRVAEARQKREALLAQRLEREGRIAAKMARKADDAATGKGETAGTETGPVSTEDIT